ncbi:DUF177 domain-containing protein [uncultured Amnibacterium sp.]|uniref:YceD family protein n=1 Tax=uncultured Amnibacterium sp. TaxID=1631851 RepID=UPI0035CC89C8
MNARSPYLQNVRDLVRHPGEMRERTLDITVSEHLGEGMIAVQDGAPLHIDLKLESLHEGVLASGTVVGTADGECARCLAPVSLRVRVEFAELFGYPADEPFDHQLDGDQLDLEPVVRDAVVLALPFQPECVDGCEDLELGPGISLITADDEREKPADPRWGALQAFSSGEQSRAGDTDSREEK